MRSTDSQSGWMTLSVAATGLSLAMFVGCARTTEEDVTDAREAAQQERDELTEVRTEAREATQDEQHEATEAVREQQKEVQAAEQKAREA